MSKWITDRLPTKDDAKYNDAVWMTDAETVNMHDRHVVKMGQAWMPIEVPDPYMKPKRYKARYHTYYKHYYVYDSQSGAASNNAASHIPTLEAAERIADIYNEATQ